ncbi:stage II sporulation protein P [Anaerobacillus isosaccharinicus]|uniref:Stage II sporulation protein P n=1 Tax=Anaerobacillus isosaccharinicus TaxID=1532552 RepID=A0A1S2LR80_9BACI|nr:stage II sporulation protein P [Anaerobacillus isosaccharinicus]MBA5585480.1 stage II sporulation protein P [Anaerobacillus isosaccharinicus]QOY36203.1 stage II sporulation protein P [Anaerobacillus isosaccharinicus]
MSSRNFKGFTISLNRTSFKRLAILVIVGIIALFIVTGMLTAFEPGYGISSSTVYAWSSYVSSDALVYMMGTENPYFTQVLPEGSGPPKISALAFELATSLNPEDPRSLLGRELPGFALFDGKIIVAGEGTDFTNMPIESAPPMEVMMAEREASKESLEKLDKQKEEFETPQVSTDGRKVIHIIHSHSRESFLPELKDTNSPNQAFHPDVNITLVGDRLGRELEKRGIGVDVDKSDIGALLSNRGWVYGQSYDASREIVKAAMATNADFEFFFDLHRDAQPRNITTVTINGIEYAKTLFIIGENHKNYEKNAQLAAELHALLDKKYPGLSRGVIAKGGSGSNGRYNQDLSPNSILVEFGGVENTLEEAYRSAEAFAEVFSEFYWNAQKVNK